MANELDFGTGIALIKGLGGKPTDAQVTSAVDAWLDDHPEATTTVEDGSITKAKLDSNLAGAIDDVSDLKTEISDLEDAVANKANVDGSYPDMTVGNAEQLVATIGIEDAVPYNFRTAGGSADIGDREVDKIVGGTLAWNQLVRMTTNPITNNGVTASMDENGVITLSGTSTGGYANIFSNVPVYLNHIYLSNYQIIANPNNIGIKVNLFNINWNSGMIQKNTTANVNSGLGISGFASGTDLTGIKLTAGMVDLTQMFGSTIADYIYSLEQATAGAGVAWFRKLFPAPYYAYNAGELMSVQTSAHKMVGFNAWDEEWEAGRINIANGENTTGAGIRSKGMIPVVPSSVYHAVRGSYTGAGSILIYYYDADQTYLFYENKIGSSVSFTTPSNACYIRFNVQTSSDVTYNHDICINLSWDGERDGEYEPYQAWEYPLDSDLTLRGIPLLDADNNLYYDGDTYESDGTVTRRYGVVDLGTLDWSTASSSDTRTVYTTTITSIKHVASNTEKMHAICPKFEPVTIGTTWTAGMMSSSSANSTSCSFITSAGAYTDASAFKAAMSGVYLVYELAESTTETADPYQNPQIVEDFGTEEYIDTRDVAIPVGHDTTYRANLRAKLEMSPNSPDGDGDYIVRQANGQNEYVLLTKELPAAPSSDGNYILKCTVTSGTPTYTWEAQT